jgi:hypothetical protein
MEPYEIIMSPFTVYIAPVGESFPDVDETPSGNWATLGTNGLRNQSDDGVTVTHSQTLSEHRNAGSTGPMKVTRQEESLVIGLTLEDLTAEAYAKVLNNQTVTDTAAGSGTPGDRAFPLYQGKDVSTFALLVKGVSPYGDSWAAQYEIPVCYQSANPAPVFTKGEAAALAVEFTALEDPDAASASERFGHYRSQDADAT